MKHYEKADIKILPLEGTGAILTGSVTTTEVTPSNVGVQPLDNGFSDQTDGFQSISFD